MPPPCMEASVAKTRQSISAARLLQSMGQRLANNASSSAATLERGLSFGLSVSRSLGGITWKTSFRMAMTGRRNIAMDTKDPTRLACRASEVYGMVATLAATEATPNLFAAGDPQTIAPLRASSGLESTSAPTTLKTSSSHTSLSSDPMMPSSA